MSIYVADPFDALSTGFFGTPPGWSGNCLVVGPDGAFGTHHFGQGFFSNFATPIFDDHTPSPNSPQVQVCFGAKLSPGFQVNISAKNLLGNPLSVLQLNVEGDMSLSVKCAGSVNSFLTYGGGTRANTGTTDNYFYGGVWYYFQLNVASTAGSGTNAGFLEVTSDLIVDGTECIPPSTNATIPLSNFTVNTYSFDQVGFNGNTGYLCQVQISDWLTPLPDLTNPLAKIPQAVIEAATISTNAQVRIPQMVIEAQTLPTTAKVRIPQAVIELATLRQKYGGSYAYIGMLAK